MRSSFTSVAVLVAICGLLTSCGSSSSDASLRYEEFTVASAAIGDNLLGDPATGQIAVLLPPSYDTSPDRRYPVAYYLHGFRESPTDIHAWSPAVQQAMANGRELIVVGLQGANRLGGSFYVDSPVTGRWEEWVTSEAIAAVDARYRTLATRESRALFGFSMGGFGALNLGLRHPDLYTAVFAMAGGLFQPTDGLQNALSSWGSEPSVAVAYGAAFAPNTSGSDPFAQVPRRDGTQADNDIVALWEAGFGGWGAKLDAYAALPQKLSAIRIEWADQDSYGWISEGSEWLADEMAQRQLPVEAHSVAGGHQFPNAEVRSGLIPFLQAHLAFSCEGCST